MTQTPTRPDWAGFAPGPYPGYQGEHPTQPLPGGAPMPPSAPMQAPPRPARRGPGWGGVIGSALAAAVLASGLTAGAFTLLGGTGSGLIPASGASSAPVDPAPALGDGTLDWAKVADAVSPSVVTIKVAGASASGTGSGVILDHDGHILTNEHVAAGGGQGAKIEVVLSDGRVYDKITVVGLDPATDLAVLKIAEPPADLVPATLGDSSRVTVGQPVMAVGNPLGLADTVTTGIVSATDRPVSTSGEGNGSTLVVTNAIQTDAAINPGNSGGALVDATGSVIGIPSSIASLSQSGNSQGGNIGLGFAIPSNEAKRISDELITSGKATHAWLGVQLDDGAGTADGTTRQGAVITQVVDGTPAQQAGLATGDVIVTIDGETVSGAESLTAQVRERGPGDKVVMGVVRDGTLIEVSVTLATRQDEGN